MNKISLCLFPEGRDKCLTMSYDDGRVDDIALVEIFNKYGIKGTFHLNSGLWGVDGFLKEEQVKELYKGHEVSCHMSTHPWPCDIPSVNVVSELLEDRKKIESTCNCVVRGMSYPFGNYNDEVIQACRSAGMEYSRTVESTHTFEIPKDFMKWHPTCKHTMNPIGMIDDFLKEERHQRMKLFYVWGHSFEFPRDNNWDMIEEFCRRLGNRNDIWYATNIEVYDYIMAVHSLRFSANMDRVYNPSAIDVWIRVNGNSVRVKTGDMVNL